MGAPQIGEHCFILESQVIQPYARIGNNVVLWSGNHIGHHSSIGDHCFVASHVVVSGNVQVGSHCFLGVNATIGDGIAIGDRCIIGASAVVLRDVPAEGIYGVKQTERHRLTTAERMPL